MPVFVCIYTEGRYLESGRLQPCTAKDRKRRQDAAAGDQENLHWRGRGGGCWWNHLGTNAGANADGEVTNNLNCFQTSGELQLE